MPDALTPAQPASASAGKGRVFMSRLGSTLGLWAVIAVALMLQLDWLLLGMMALVGVLGTWEYFRLQPEGPQANAYTRGALVIGGVYWAAILWWSAGVRAEPPWWLEGALLLVTVQGAFFLAFCRALEGEATLRRLFNGVFGVVYTTLLWGFMARLLLLKEAADGRYLVLLVIMVTKFGDMGAYTVGSWLGRHKMVPHISPGKSWEGFGGAILGGYVAMVTLMLVNPDALAPLTWGYALLLAPLLCVWGVMGDLAESVIKRCHQIKDSGHKLPGIGGILDLTDSLLFTAPVAYFYLKLIA